MKKKQQQKVSILASSWKQIQELFEELRYEPYIDDQWQIEEVWEISEALIKRGELAQEDWELRKNILSDIIQHDYYDQYGCYDPIFNLSEELCSKPEEYLAFARILEGKSG